MIPNPTLILALVLVFALSNAFSYMKGSKHTENQWVAKITAERLAATEAARVKETQWQGVVNATSKAYLARIDGIRGNLAVALDSLRQRPERPRNLPDHPRPDCAGASGAELSRADGEFLAGEAARADELRAGLETCYAFADALK